MRILKWTPGFRFEEDPPVVPIWVSLYDLPIEFMHSEVIYSMATALGQPLKVDTPTLNMTCPSVARFCVEVDLTRDLLKSARIGKKGHKHEQIFTFEHVPSYCVKCSKIGHKDFDCRMGKPLPQNNKVEPSVAKKKGIILAQLKPKVTFKEQNKKPGLEVEILQLDPLIAKGIETEGDKSLVHLSWSAKTLETLEAHTMVTPAVETLEQRRVESTSGLSMKEKELILVDLQPSPDRIDVESQPVINPKSPENRE
ncbi:OLC1v1004954C1 [Oldenlandia corymbosa var. corymbosa]|uniref:OLC1v1004954C1 n=1 Tax=Oldenlandia corymbosa var. corymbosa TaxID=529605 RepID=A0AAV1DFI8_OLDCO|nr:OLC1v1004954C1 [Oldenlandia corymbosa var. corymbosa]